MAVNIRIIGVKEVSTMLRKKKRSVDKGVSRSMQKAEEILLNEVKDSIGGKKAEPKSVDTGEFILSVHGKSTKDSVVVTADAKHAKFLEFGTSKMAPRRHFSNSMARKKKKIRDLTEAKVKAALRV